MGAKVSRKDFEWVYTEEPHARRRKVILEAHPEIRQLFGCDPNFKWVVSGVVLVQLASLPVIPHLSWPIMLVVAYCFGGVLNHSLMIAIHDIGHNQAFGQARPLANRLFGFFANLPVGLPCSISFRKYHVEHHQYSTIDTIDLDLPTPLEAKLFKTTFGKFMWLLFLPIIYLVRPLLVRPLPLEPLELLNIVIQLFFNALVVQLFGWRTLWYLIIGSLITIGLHPLAGHFISEHFMHKEGLETYSYYGPLNYVTFNIGYHVEHHDFPVIPSSRLPMVKLLAPEFYDDRPYHTSYCSVLYHFVVDPDMGLYSRIRRKEKQTNCL